ncbi:MAG: hypothetical protein HQL73_06495 [Magnetococcales bacterium]|nr:hypothetical protein [Magnetococcales bacterium]
MGVDCIRFRIGIHILPAIVIDDDDPMFIGAVPSPLVIGYNLVQGTGMPFSRQRR